MSDEPDIQVVQELNRGLSYAEACFETFRVIDGAVFAWDYHWQRLQTGLFSLGLSLNPSLQHNIFQTCLDTAKKQADDCLVRLTVAGGEAAWGLNQTSASQIFIQCMPYQKTNAELHLSCYDYPFPLMDKPAKFTADYAYTLRAMQHWQMENQTPVLVCKSDVIVGGLTANIALFDGNRWLTPQGKGVLCGTVRQFLIDKDLLSLQTCTVAALKDIQAAVLLNAGSFIQVIHSINHMALDTQHPAINTLKEALTAEQGVRL